MFPWWPDFKSTRLFLSLPLPVMCFGSQAIRFTQNMLTIVMSQRQLTQWIFQSKMLKTLEFLRRGLLCIPDQSKLKSQNLLSLLNLFLVTSRVSISENGGHHQLPKELWVSKAQSNFWNYLYYIDSNKFFVIFQTSDELWLKSRLLFSLEPWIANIANWNLPRLDTLWGIH